MTGATEEEYDANLKRLLEAVKTDNLFEMETDASEFAIAAGFSQHGKPVAYFFRTLNSCEKHYPIIEKEATTIIEAIQRW